MNSNLDYEAIEEAKDLARMVHRGQTRKHSDEEYVEHCFEVGDIVASVSWTTTEMVIAAICHDVLEMGDPQETVLIYQKFNDLACIYIEGMTELTKPSYGNRYVRKRKEAKRLSLQSREVQTIKCADFISNTKDIVEKNKGFAKVYIPEKKWCLIGMDKADVGLRNRAWQQVITAERDLLLRN